MATSDSERAWLCYRQLADQPDRFTRWMLERSLQVLEVARETTTVDPHTLSDAHTALTTALGQTPETPPVPVDARVDLLALRMSRAAAGLMERLFTGDLSAWPLDNQQKARANPWGGFRAAWLEHYNHVLKSKQEMSGRGRMADTQVLSEVAGSVWKVHVKKGESVAKDQELMILESMKMEIPVDAPCAGTVADLLVAPEEGVEEDQVLLIIAS